MNPTQFKTTVNWLLGKKFLILSAMIGWLTKNESDNKKILLGKSDFNPMSLESGVRLPTWHTRKSHQNTSYYKNVVH